MSFPKIISVDAAAALIADQSVIAVSSASGLACPDAVLGAIGRRFETEGHPRNITSIHPIASGDMYGIKGIEHLAQPGLLAKVLAGSYPSGPSSLAMPNIWRMIVEDSIPAYNVPSGVLYDMLREGAAKRPGVITEVGLDTFVDPIRQGCAMNAKGQSEPVVKRIDFEGSPYLYFPAIKPDVGIIRATTADERGNLSFEHEGAYLGGYDLALAAHNNGGIVIAQVKRVSSATRKPQQIHVPGILVDYIVVVPDQAQATQTLYDPAISGEIFRPISSFETVPWGVGKAMARRVAQELHTGEVVNIGFGISANVPRILIEEGCHGAVRWVLEQGPVGGVPLLDFQFGCSSNAEAMVPAPQQLMYFQGGGFDQSLLSFMQIDRSGSVNVSRLAARPHVTSGCGGFVDITCRVKKIVFSGFFTAGAALDIRGSKLVISKEGKVKKLVEEVEHVSFSGRRAIERGQDVLYVTERCVLKLTSGGLEVVEIAPGVDLARDIQEQCAFPLRVSESLKEMDAALFDPAPLGLEL
jgi:acyl CoA:acetate/3-ketoacid CoA transferase